MTSVAPYPVLRTRVDPRLDSFRENREKNLAALERVERALAQSRAGGDAKYVARHRAAGKLLPRERVELLPSMPSRTARYPPSPS